MRNQIDYQISYKWCDQVVVVVVAVRFSFTFLAARLFKSFFTFIHFFLSVCLLRLFPSSYLSFSSWGMRVFEGLNLSSSSPSWERPSRCLLPWRCPPRPRRRCDCRRSPHRCTCDRLNNDNNIFNQKSSSWHSTVTCKVLLNRPHSKLGQHCAVRCFILTKPISRRCACLVLLCATLAPWIRISFGCCLALFIKGQMLLIDKHKLGQKYDNFGYLSTQFWLKGNDKQLTLKLDHNVHIWRVPIRIPDIKCIQRYK